MEKKKTLSSGRWLVMFLGTLVLIGLLVVAMNILVDPYGAFGDPLLQWWSYDETLNPRMAKISYLEQNHEQYDSYIVGASGSSSLPVSTLNEYLDASFYNCFFYGTNMEVNEKMCNFLLENYEVRNLLLNLSPKIAVSFGESANLKLTNYSYYKVSGESAWDFYSRYALINPMDSIKKLSSYFTDPYLQQGYRCFDAATGSYDKSRRDAEPIGELEAYLDKDAYRAFRNYPSASYHLRAIDEATASVARIRAKCLEKGVNLIVTCQPAYWENLNQFDRDEVEAFRAALAQVTDYWDFTLSSVSYEPRYFYDETHFRNDVGRMALARVFGDTSVYVPEDLGVFVPQGTVPEPLQGEPADPEDYTVELPILMYHNLVTADEMRDAETAPDWFREQMQTLKDGGYHPISFAQLRAYVMEGASLPDKPVMITFDDGYLDNYALAYPVLKEYDFPAAIFVIGVSVGKDTYKDSGVPMVPHFSLEQAREMTDSGLITIGSHGYNIHEVAGRDPEPIRRGILIRDDESEAEYAAFVKGDCAELEALLGYNPGVLTYPESKYTELSEVLLRESGIWATMTTSPKINVVVRGLEQTTRQLGRYHIDGDYTGEDLLQILETGKSPH